MKLTTIRLDILDEERDSRLLTEFLRAVGQPYVVYREIADVTGKAHYQGYIVRDEETYEEVKKTFTSTFTSTHSRYQRSFTPVRKVESYMKYVAKDKMLFASHGFDEEHIKTNEKSSYKKKLDTQDRDTMHTVILNHIQTTYELSVYSRWTLTRVAMEVADYYLKKFKKFPQDHFGRALSKGLFIELSRSDVYRRDRLRVVVRTWFNGDDEFLDSAVEHQGI